MSKIVLKVAGKVVYEGDLSPGDVEVKTSGFAGGNISLGAGGVIGVDQSIGKHVFGRSVTSVTVNGGVHVEISGDVHGNVNAGGDVSCQDVTGDVHAGSDLRCKDVKGSARAGSDLTAAQVGGSAQAGSDLRCNDVGGDAKAGSDLNCGKVAGNVRAGGDVNHR